MESANANATYLSADVQNELIRIAGLLIQEKLLAKIRLAMFWLLLGDKSEDRHGRQQFVIAIRYCIEDEDGKWKLYEDPVAVFDFFLKKFINTIFIPKKVNRNVSFRTFLGIRLSCKVSD